MAVIALVGLVALVPGMAAAQTRPLVTSYDEAQAVFVERAARAETVLRRLRRARRVENITPSEARSIFDVQLALAWGLVHIHPQAGDANGAVRRWDASARNVVRLGSSPPEGGDTDVPGPGVVAAFGSPGPDSCLLRNHLLDRAGADLDRQRRELLAGLAARRLAADRAADRRARGLSCEDLPDPMQFAWGALLAEEPQGLWWSLNVAMFGEPALLELRTAGEREAAIILPAILGALAAAAPDAIASFADRGPTIATPACGGRPLRTRDDAGIRGAGGLRAAGVDLAWLPSGAGESRLDCGRPSHRLCRVRRGRRELRGPAAVAHRRCAPG